jgi:hypothetical protein
MAATGCTRLRCDVVGCAVGMLMEGTALAVREHAATIGWDNRPAGAARVRVDVCPVHQKLLETQSLEVQVGAERVRITRVRWARYHG